MFPREKKKFGMKVDITKRLKIQKKIETKRKWGGGEAACEKLI